MLMTYDIAWLWCTHSPLLAKENMQRLHQKTDDTTFIFSASSQQELIDKTNQKLEKMNYWYRCNKLTVHPGKTLFMCFQESKAELYNNKIIWDGTPLNRAGKMENDKYVRYVGINRKNVSAMS